MRHGFSIENGRQVFSNEQLKIWRCPTCKWWRDWEDLQCPGCHQHRDREVDDFERYNAAGSAASGTS